MDAGCGMRGDGCGVRGARCGVRGASFEVGIGMIYEWACLSITADCVEMRAKARFLTAFYPHELKFVVIDK